LVYLDNGWEAAVAIFAVLKAGAIFSPINPSTKPDKLAFIAGNCQARAIITQARLAGAVAEAIGEGAEFSAIISAGESAALPDAVLLETLLVAEARRRDHGGIDSDLAMLIYTSGSTGRPKGVMMNHRNIEAAATSITTYLENTEDDIILNVLSLAFDCGRYQLLMAIKLVATLIIEKSSAYAAVILHS